MTMAPFDELFPELARSESRSITVIDHDRLLPGSYLLREAYCVEPGCDCRRVVAARISARTLEAMVEVVQGMGPHGQRG